MIDNHLPKNIMGGGGTPNPKKLMKELKKHYWRAFLALIKAYKRYYLGAWIIKLPFYKLTSNQHKFTKWQAKRDERLEFLHNALQYFKNVKKFFKTYYKDIKKWLNSPEFKTKYLDTNHPYPPFLNPNIIDYESIPAEIAWEMNLPLPPNYDFLIIMMSHSGHSSTVTYLQKCGVNIMRHHHSILKDHYCFNYESLVQKKPNVAINITAYSGKYNGSYYKELAKLILSTQNSSPILWIVRDPIQRLLSALNNAWERENVVWQFDENTSLSVLENRRFYHIDRHLSFGERIKLSIEVNTFAYARLYELLHKFGFNKITFLDMQNYTKPKDIFELFCNLAEKYHFKRPQKKEDFEFKITRSYMGFLPLSYKAMNIKFQISTDRVNALEVSQILALQKNDFEREIYIYTEKTNLSQILANKDYIKNKLQIFINKLKEVLIFEEKFNKTNKEQLMNFLSQNKNEREFLKNIFDKETHFIKKHRPDIVASWKYYNEFEKMCAELDGEKDEK